MRNLMKKTAEEVALKIRMMEHYSRFNDLPVLIGIEMIDLIKRQDASIREFIEREDKIIEAAKNLLETIDAYELEDEIDAGEDDDGVVKVLRTTLKELELEE